MPKSLTYAVSTQTPRFQADGKSEDIVIDCSPVSFGAHLKVIFLNIWIGLPNTILLAPFFFPHYA